MRCGRRAVAAAELSQVYRLGTLGSSGRAPSPRRKGAGSVRGKREPSPYLAAQNAEAERVQTPCRTGRQRQRQTFRRLLKADVPSAQHRHGPDPTRKRLSSCGQGPHAELALLRPSHHPYVQDLSLFREPDVRGVQAACCALVEGCGIAHIRGAFSEDGERSRAVDAFAMHLHPCRELLQKGVFVLIDGSIATQGNVQQEVAVFTDNVDQRLRDRLCRLIPVLLEDGTAVVPLADTGIGLPRCR